MRMSQLFTQTLRDAPTGSDLPGYSFLQRAGFVQPLAAGILAALPLARWSARRLEKQAFSLLGLDHAQEIELPLILPAELATGASLFHDSNGRLLAAGGSELIALADVLRGSIRSYRQLPANLVSSGASWADDSRSQAGWLRARSSRILSAYFLTLSASQQAEMLARLESGILELLQQCDLPIRTVETVPKPFSTTATGWFWPHPGLNDAVLYCPHCGYSAEAGTARFARTPAAAEPALPLQKVATPHCPTIDSLAAFLGVSTAQTAKAVFLTADLGTGREPAQQKLIFVVVRGDREVSETKLSHILSARLLRPSTNTEIAGVGAVPGYASPIGLKDAWVIVDQEIPNMSNLVSGANEEGYHLLNVNYGRDYSAHQVADIAAARPGDDCPLCGENLQKETGVFVSEVQQIAALPGCNFIGENGQVLPLPVLAASLDIYRLMACLAEQHHDDQGIIWPVLAAPFDIHLVLLSSKTGSAETQAAVLYKELQIAGWQVLFDDRAESAGVKFKDADLIGIPVRLTVSERALNSGGIEFKLRSAGEKWIVPLEAVKENLRRILNTTG